MASAIFAHARPTSRTRSRRFSSSNDTHGVLFDDKNGTTSELVVERHLLGGVRRQERTPPRLVGSGVRRGRTDGMTTPAPGDDERDDEVGLKVGPRKRSAAGIPGVV